MIFVTVGSQMPFDRLVRAVDSWAGRTRQREVFAQIGDSAYRPAHIKWADHLTPYRFSEFMQAASLVVAHAGMGTILTAMELQKPIIVMPRRGDLRETRNDHQLATARKFEASSQIAVVYDETMLAERLGRIDTLKPAAPIQKHASVQLIGTLKDFLSNC